MASWIRHLFKGKPAHIKHAAARTTSSGNYTNTQNFNLPRSYAPLIRSADLPAFIEALSRRHPDKTEISKRLKMIANNRELKLNDPGFPLFEVRHFFQAEKATLVLNQFDDLLSPPHGGAYWLDKEVRRLCLERKQHEVQENTEQLDIPDLRFDLHDSSWPLNKARHEIKNDFSPVHCNLYFSPVGQDHPAFRFHYDPWDLVILQQEGEKTWEIGMNGLYDPSRIFVSPPSHQGRHKGNGNTTSDQEKTSREIPDGHPCLEKVTKITLRPGDLLYLPNATPHRAVCEGGGGEQSTSKRTASTAAVGSLHLTFGIENSTRSVAYLIQQLAVCDIFAKHEESAMQAETEFDLRNVDLVDGNRSSAAGTNSIPSLYTAVSSQSFLKALAHLRAAVGDNDGKESKISLSHTFVRDLPKPAFVGDRVGGFHAPAESNDDRKSERSIVGGGISNESGGLDFDAVLSDGTIAFAQLRSLILAQRQELLVATASGSGEQEEESSQSSISTTESTSKSPANYSSPPVSPLRLLAEQVKFIQKDSSISTSRKLTGLTTTRKKLEAGIVVEHQMKMNGNHDTISETAQSQLQQVLQHALNTLDNPQQLSKSLGALAYVEANTFPGHFAEAHFKEVDEMLYDFREETTATTSTEEQTSSFFDFSFLSDPDPVFSSNTEHANVFLLTDQATQSRGETVGFLFVRGQRIPVPNAEKLIPGLKWCLGSSSCGVAEEVKVEVDHAIDSPAAVNGGKRTRSSDIFSSRYFRASEAQEKGFLDSVGFALSLGLLKHVREKNAEQRSRRRYF
ncbi:unnamed protein product [Amoebophrya sp. A120]|nr:unnamed protein product [Amoebophrya sp. A120]|eukprot:GSA120T00009426001.1